ncbi:MAG: hypothetical protein L0Y64_25125 [Myxococcaceae bacterium]|nr:hypothetical protein [Myxococcaceae bacterium]
MTRSYSMRGVMGAAERAVHLVRQHLLTSRPGSQLHDVSVDPRFQHRGVDLLWEQVDGSVLGVEVKGDRQPRRTNYFFELISNLERDTPGCFLYSHADLLAYVFLTQRELHLLPLARVREWFLPRAKGYTLRHTSTRTGAIKYTTVGAVVPVADVHGDVSGAERYRIEPDGTFTPLALRSTASSSPKSTVPSPPGITLPSPSGRGTG